MRLPIFPGKSIIDTVKSFLSKFIPKHSSDTVFAQKAQAHLPTEYGKFLIYVYTTDSGVDHVALVHGELRDKPLVRLHSSCMTGDVFSSLRCDCGEQLKLSMELIAKEQSGIILYLDQEGRGIGLANKIKAYALQEEGLDTVEANEKLGFSADARDYTPAVRILQDLGIQQIRLLTNNPTKVTQLQKLGITVEKVSLEVAPNEINRKYLETKKHKMGHILTKV